MFKGLVFVILAAFVAFGVTLFMATNEMEARLVTAGAVPVEAVGTNPQTPGSATKAKTKKSRSTNRSGSAPTSGTKGPDHPSPTQVIAPIPKNSPLVERWRLLD